MKRNEILDSAKSILGEWGDNYGELKCTFGKIAALWEAYLRVQCISGVETYIGISTEDVAHMMALLKLARIMGENRDVVVVKNSYMDAVGYLALAGEMAIEEE